MVGWSIIPVQTVTQVGYLALKWLTPGVKMTQTLANIGSPDAVGGGHF